MKQGSKEGGKNILGNESGNRWNYKQNEVRIEIGNLEATSVTETDTTGWSYGKGGSMKKQIKIRELS